MVQVRAIPIQQEREDVHVAVQYAAGFHCLVEEWNQNKKKSGFVNKKWGSREASDAEEAAKLKDTQEM